MSATCSSMRHFRALLALATVVLLSCTERSIVGPERVDSESPDSPARFSHDLPTLGCTVSWKEAVDGLWTDATKWDGGVVPGASDDVCITVDGAYSVTVRAGQAAHAITVGTAGAATNGQRLVIEGIRPAGSAPATNATLTVGTDVVNSGTIRMNSTGATTSGNSTLILTAGTLSNTASGVIETLLGSAGGRTILANIVNDGRIDIQAPTSINLSGARYTNNNVFTVGAARTLAVVGTFVQAGGTLTVDGAFNHTAGAFHLDGGAISGIPTLSGLALNVGPASTATGAVRVIGINTLSGDVRAGQTIIIEGIRGASSAPSTSATLTAATSFSNSGTIRLTSTGFTTSGNATLSLTDGTLTNTATGVIETLFGSQGGRNILANIVNDGTIDIQAPTSINRAGARYTNNNAFTVAAARTLALVGTFVQAAGTLTVDGPFNHTAGEFHLNGGIVNGIPNLTSIGVVIGPSSSGSGTLRVMGTSTLSGDVMAGQTILIEGIRGASSAPSTSATLTAATSFSNSGTIRLTSTGFTTSGNATLSLTAGTLTNTATGVIETLVGSGGGRNILANIVNNGSIDIQSPASMNRSGAEYTNNNSFVVGATHTLAVVGAFIQAGGTLTVDGVFDQTAGAFHLNGGVIAGIPTLSALSLNVGPGSTAIGTVRMIRASTLSGNVMAGQTIIIEGVRGSLSGPAVNASLTAAGDFTNAGIIRLTSSGATGSGSSTLTIASGTLTNTAGGQIETLPGTGGGRSMSGAIINDGSISLGVGTTYSSGTMRNVAPGTIIGGSTLTLGAAAAFVGSGSITANIVNAGQFHVGASPGLLSITGTYSQSASGTFHLEIGGSIAGSDFDRLVVSGATSLAGTLNVSKVSGACTETGSSYEFMTFASRAGDFTVKNGLNPGAGQTYVTVPTATNYRLNVIGAACPVPDNTAPVISAQVVGTLGNNDWYVSDVTVTWQVIDLESSILSSTGCGESHVLNDNVGITFTCSATSSGGANSASVTIKRDATVPLVLVDRAPLANAFGWNRTDVLATLSATDATSGVDGDATGSLSFTSEGENQSGSITFTDLAGNVASGIVSGVSIDKTEPTVEVSRSAEPNTFGWYNTDVLVTFSATDALSGIDGSMAEVVTFAAEGENQSGSHTFMDRAGNSAVGIVNGVSIDKTRPVVQVSRSLEPNAFGWNNTDVIATFSATDILSGIDGSATESIVFSAEGADQSGSHTFADRAGNVASGTADGISIDRTEPMVLVNRSPAPDASGWNNTDVTATFEATDALSGIDGEATAIVIFSTDGADQGATRSFADRAGNVGTGTVSGINIDRGGPAVGVACSANPSQLWSPNGRMVPVTVSFNGADGLSTVSSFLLRSVTSNESQAATDIQSFLVGTADTQGSLRAARDGSGQGRVYSLVYDVWDRSGNPGECVVRVTVPHDQRRIAADRGAK